MAGCLILSRNIIYFVNINLEKHGTNSALIIVLTDKIATAISEGINLYQGLY